LYFISITGRQDLSLPAQLDAVPPQPVAPPGAALSLVELVTLAKATGALARCRQASQLPVLLDRVTHPVDFGVAGDSSMVDIDHDHLEVLICRVLTNPVGIHDSQPFKPSSNPFLSNGLKVSLGFLLLHSSRGLRFSIGATLGNRALAATTPHRDTVDTETWN